MEEDSQWIDIQAQFENLKNKYTENNGVRGARVNQQNIVEI